jgi:hypothetical protein
MDAPEPVRAAEREGLIDRAPPVDLLPRDQSQPIVPPTEDELRAILNTAEDFRPTERLGRRRPRCTNTRTVGCWPGSP